MTENEALVEFLRLAGECEESGGDCATDDRVIEARDLWLSIRANWPKWQFIGELAADMLQVYRDRGQLRYEEIGDDLLRTGAGGRSSRVRGDPTPTLRQVRRAAHEAAELSDITGTAAGLRSKELKERRAMVDSNVEHPPGWKAPVPRRLCPTCNRYTLGPDRKERLEHNRRAQERHEESVQRRRGCTPHEWAQRRAMERSDALRAKKPGSKLHRGKEIPLRKPPVRFFDEE